MKNHKTRLNLLLLLASFVFATSGCEIITRSQNKNAAEERQEKVKATFARVEAGDKAAKKGKHEVAIQEYEAAKKIGGWTYKMNIEDVETRIGRSRQAIAQGKRRKALEDQREKQRKAKFDAAREKLQAFLKDTLPSLKPTKTNYKEVIKTVVNMRALLKKNKDEEGLAQLTGATKGFWAGVEKAALGAAAEASKAGDGISAYNHAVAALNAASEERRPAVAKKLEQYKSGCSDSLVKLASGMPNYKALEAKALLDQALSIVPGHAGAMKSLPVVKVAISKYSPAYIKSIQAFKDGAAYRLYVVFANKAGEPVQTYGEALMDFKVLSGRYPIYELGAFTAKVKPKEFKASLLGLAWVSPRIKFSQLAGPGGNLETDWLKKDIWRHHLEGNHFKVIFTHSMPGQSELTFQEKVTPP